ncbi:NAD(P)-dependent oxidoreductase [Cryptosporangium sp. NPDC048952]|uniref:NAD(P)-dependent oxidoreductase n=1 Tax=Cryptosporangium sp. NPDC048952 TaxID=3363961 RepID=UPI00371AE8C7
MATIAFLGLGRMGLPMATNLAAAGHELTVWNRSAAKAERFATDHGAKFAGTPREAVGGAAVVITMLAADDALLDAYTGPDGALPALGADTLCIDMSTVSPGTVQRLSALVADRGCTFLDAPVSGSVAAATAATLTIMAAGPTEAVDRARPVLRSLGDPVIHLGDSGRGAAMKLVVNAIVHSLNGAVSEALVLAERCGIERTAAYAVFLNSAIAAPFVGYRQEAFEKPGEVPVAFRLELAAKDLRLALALAEQAGAALPQTRVNLEQLERAAAGGYADADESALADYLRRS